MKIRKRGCLGEAHDMEIAVVSARFETGNRELKHFDVLTKPFRHFLHLHSDFFHTVAHLIQLSLDHESDLCTIYK